MGRGARGVAVVVVVVVVADGVAAGAGGVAAGCPSAPTAAAAVATPGGAVEVELSVSEGRVRDFFNPSKSDRVEGESAPRGEVDKPRRGALTGGGVSALVAPSLPLPEAAFLAATVAM